MTDSLHPAIDDALEAWAARVKADHAQVERCREVADLPDFYAPVTSRFRMDPRRTDDATLNMLLSLARPDDVWLDIGSGAGRYALPLALTVREVVAIDPSPSMLAALSEDAAANGIENIRVITARWPIDAGPPGGDVGLMAHVGYDIADISPLLDALEAAASRLCVTVMGESAMTTAATLFWEAIHGEPRVQLPALPELLVLLASRNRIPEVRLVDRTPPTFDSVDQANAMARRQLWVREGSAKDQQLRDLMPRALSVAQCSRMSLEIRLLTWRDQLARRAPISKSRPPKRAARWAPSTWSAVTCSVRPCPGRVRMAPQSSALGRRRGTPGPAYRTRC